MRVKWWIGLAIAAAAVSQAAAQTYPAHTVRIVVPFAAGGGADVTARVLGTELSGRWGQPVVIENRTGAGSLIGTEAVARAPADGYTLLITTSQTFTSNRFLYKSLPYDIDRGFVAITLIVQSDQFLLANTALPTKNLDELIALARQPQQQVTYGSWGVGSEPQLTYEQLNKREGIRLLHVPYKGVAPVLTALLGGEVQLTVGSAGVAGSLLRAGKLKALAIAGQKRNPQFADVPTTAEAGYPYLRVAILIGLWAPSGIPAPVLEKIGTDARSLLKAPSFAEKHFGAGGFQVVANTSEEFAALLREETARIGEVVQAANIKPE